jgi:hypothetical protein
MPIYAMSPSTFIHSWSLVYFSPAGNSMSLNFNGAKVIKVYLKAGADANQKALGIGARAASE